MICFVFSGPGTLQAGTYTLSGGDGIVESNWGADGNATKIQVILDETVAGSGVNITEHPILLPLFEVLPMLMCCGN